MDDAAPRLPYRVKEVAELFSVSEGYIRKEIREGRLKAAHKRNESRTWWIKQEWIDEWVKGGMLESPKEGNAA